MTFAQSLTYLMEQHGNISNYRLAKDLGVTQTSIANWISGAVVPHKKTQIAIAEYFNISVDEFTGENPPPIRKTKKEPDTQTDAGLSTIDQEIIELFKRLSPEEQVRELAYLRDRAASQDK